MLQIRALWWTSAVLMFMLSSWYAAHEYHTPGYVNTVWHNEVTARFLEPSEGHGGPWYYYILQLAKTDFPYWPLAAGGFGASLWLLRSRVAGFVGFQLFAFLFLLSQSATKIEWYAAPALPMLACGIGLLLAPANNIRVRMSIFAVCLTAIAAIFSQTTLKRLSNPVELRSPGPEDELSLYLLNRHATLKPDTAFRVITADYSPTALLYTRWPGENHGVRTADWQKLDSGIKVMAWHAVQLDSLKAWYQYRLVQYNGHLHKLQILGKKEAHPHLQNRQGKHLNSQP